jgi:periplasmic protein CpxP/Spy
MDAERKPSTEMPAMKATLLTRAAPLLITTMLVAAPAWAQSTNPTTMPPSGTSPATPQTPPLTPSTMAPSTAQSATPAQTAPSGTAQKAMPHSARSAARGPGDTMQSMVDQRITELHSRLHITADQKPQWDQFTQVMRDNAKQMDDVYQQRAQQMGTMSAVDNMQSYAQIEEQRAQDMQKLVPAFQTLYASLSDQQKKTADQMFRANAEKAQTRRQAAAAK